MADYNKFDQFIADVANKVHNLGADTLKVMLTNSAPLATNTVKANLTEISPGFGYTAGGATVTINSSAQVGGVYTLDGDDVTFTAVGGSIGPFRYAVLYNDTPTSPADPLIGWWDYGSDVTLGTGENIVIDFLSSDILAME